VTLTDRDARAGRTLARAAAVVGLLYAALSAYWVSGGLIDKHPQSIVRRPSRAEPERTVGHVGLEDRLEHDLRRHLHDPVTGRGNRKRSLVGALQHAGDPLRIG
jgi:hypothetical protein